MHVNECRAMMMTPISPKVNCAHSGSGSSWPFPVALESLSASLAGMPAAWLIFSDNLNLPQFPSWPGRGGNLCLSPPPGSERRILLGAFPSRRGNRGERWHVRAKGLSLLETTVNEHRCFPSFFAERITIEDNFEHTSKYEQASMKTCTSCYFSINMLPCWQWWFAYKIPFVGSQQ